VEKDKTDAAIQISLRNSAPYGPHTFVAYGSAQVEYSEVGADPKGKKERKKKRTTFPSNPVTIQAAPPVTLAASEIKAVIPAGGQLKVPFEVRRLEGVDGEVEAALQIPAGLKGFSAAAVKLKKGENTGEILLQSELDGDEVEACGFQLRTRVDFAGKTFEEKSNLHLAVERRPPLHIAVVGDSPWEICLGGTLLVPVRVDLADGVTGKVSVALTAPKETKGIEGAPVELAEGSRVGQVKVFLREGGPGELQGLELEASIEKDGKKFAVKAPLPRVRVRAALEIGGVAQARVGALRIEMRRHPSLQAGSDLRLRLEATAPAGLSTKAEVHFEKGESSKGVLLDTASLLDLQKNAPLFPLKIRAGILSEKGEVVEEHVLEAN